MKTNATFTHRSLESEMRRLGKRLDALMTNARRAETKLQAGTLRQLARLKAKQAQAQKALAKLGRRSTAASGPVKAGVRKAWHDIEAAVRQATRRFRETG